MLYGVAGDASALRVPRSARRGSGGGRGGGAAARRRARGAAAALCARAPPAARRRRRSRAAPSAAAAAVVHEGKALSQIHQDMNEHTSYRNSSMPIGGTALKWHLTPN